MTALEIFLLFIILSYFWFQAGYTLGKYIFKQEVIRLGGKIPPVLE